MDKKNIDAAKQSWSQAPDEHIFKAVNNIGEYDPEIRQIILDEEEKRKNKSHTIDNQLEEEKLSNYKTLDYWVIMLYVAALVSVFAGFSEHWLYFIQAGLCIVLSKGVTNRNRVAGVLVFLLCILNSVLLIIQNSPANIVVIPLAIFGCYYFGFRAMMGIFRYHSFQRKQKDLAEVEVES